MAQSRANAQFVQPSAFVRTYDPPIAVDPWTFTRRYQAASSIVNSHEDVSPSTVSHRVKLPESAIERWFFGDEHSAPQLIEELELAKKLGWIGISPTTKAFRGFNVLVSSAYALGNISAESFESRFAVRSTHDIDRVAWAITRIGIKYRMARSSEEARARELIPTEHGRILGRVLVTLGAPTDDDIAGSETLPDYLSRVSREHQLAFAKTFLESHPRAVAANKAIRIQESRTADFLDDLTRFLEEVSGGTVTRQEQDIVVSADAALALGRVVG